MTAATLVENHVDIADEVAVENINNAEKNDIVEVTVRLAQLAEEARRRNGDVFSQKDRSVRDIEIIIRSLQTRANGLEAELDTLGLKDLPQVRAMVTSTRTHISEIYLILRRHPDVIIESLTPLSELVGQP